MKKKTLAALLILTVAFSLGACGSKSTSDADTSAVSESTQTLIDDGPMALYESALGYSVEFNTDMFTVTATDVSDTFTYSGDELEPESPIYVAIQHLPEMDAESAATSLATFSGQDGVEASECTFGDGNEGYFVSYSEEAENITTNLMFYIVSKGEGCIILEIGNYDGYDSIEIDGNIELIVDSFKQA
jgi:predicted small lipoprotein YifL